MRNQFELVEEELDTGKEFVLHEGTFNECTDVFESMFGFTYYEGIEINSSKYYIREI